MPCVLPRLHGTAAPRCGPYHGGTEDRERKIGCRSQLRLSDIRRTVYADMVL
jgi:hypothetical protein